MTTYGRMAHINGHQSGHDIDIWGDGGGTHPTRVPHRGGDEPCPVKADGRCPDGCRQCEEFAREFDWLAERAVMGIEMGPQ